MESPDNIRRQDKTGKIRRVRTTSKYTRPKLSTLGIVLAMFLTLAVVKAQDIYEGCGHTKKCLGFEKGRDDVQTNCLETKVMLEISSISWHKTIKKFFPGLSSGTGLPTISHKGLC